MKKGSKPKDKYVLSIHFDTQVGLENFMAWYSNSGEQDSRYYEESYGKDWIYVKPSDEACPECEFEELNESEDEEGNACIDCTNCGWTSKDEED